MSNHPLNVLRHYVTGAVERGEATPIVGVSEYVPTHRADVSESHEWTRLYADSTPYYGRHVDIQRPARPVTLGAR